MRGPNIETVVSCFGIQRSGIHAITGWIMDESRGSKLYLNGVTSTNPFVSFTSAEVEGANIEKFLYKPQSLGRLIRRIRPRTHGRYKTWKWDRRKLAEGRWDLLLAVWENCFLYDTRVQRYLDTRLPRWRPVKHIPILILRDPFNHFASLKKSGRLEGVGHDTYTHLWKQYAKEYLDPKFLPSPVVVNYNAWTQSREYRIALAQQIGFESNGEPYDKTPGHGGGSSFEGLLSNSPSGTGNRWREYARDPSYLSLFDDEVKSLANRIFNSDVVENGLF